MVWCHEETWDEREVSGERESRIVNTVWIFQGLITRKNSFRIFKPLDAKDIWISFRTNCTGFLTHIFRLKMKKKRKLLFTWSRSASTLQRGKSFDQKICRGKVLTLLDDISDFVDLCNKRRAIYISDKRFLTATQQEKHWSILRKNFKNSLLFVKKAWIDPKIMRFVVFWFLYKIFWYWKWATMIT